MFKETNTSLLVGVMALVALTAGVSPAFAQAGAATDPCDAAPAGVTPGRVLYDLNGIECQVQAAVEGALAAYSARGTASFDAINSAGLAGTVSIAPFVMDASTLTIVAHGAVPGSVGQYAQTMDSADKTIGQIRAALERDGKTWIEHIDINPAIGQDQPKRTLLQLHGGYMFAAGYYLPDAEVQQHIEDTVRIYESNGRGAFGIITPDAPVTTNDLYPFVIDFSSWIRVADGVVPSRVNQPDTILDTSTRSVADVRADLLANGATWATYTFDNPATEIKQLKRTWLYLHDGYVFGSGYYPDDTRAQSQVDSAIILYTAHGNSAFGMITPAVPDPLSTQSTFVLDARTMGIVAHARLPDLVGTTYPHLAEASKPLPTIMAELRAGEDAGTGVWIWHMARNLATQTDQLTHTYLVLHKGHIFGASYSLPDIRARSVIDDAIYTYRNDPATGFDVIDSGSLNRIDLFPMVLNGTHILAHGAAPHLVGPLPEVRITRSGDFEQSALEEGYSWWVQFAFFNPHTGITQIQRSLAIIHDGYRFAAPYIIADADTQSVTDYARFTYESNRQNDAWKDIITPDAPIVTDALYPFVIDAATWTRLADGVVPARVGQPETILETSGRTVEDVRRDLEENGRTWLTYTFHNPATGVEQLKRTYLQLRDGLVFGSGYYLLDSQVQAVVFSGMLDLDNKGRDATLSAINTVPDDVSTTYAFVVNPQTGDTLAQNVDPARIGGVPDWDAIAAVLSTQGILDAIGEGTGTWVSYPHTSPVTGEQEIKRTWLAMRGGLVFGSGYYTSDIPESDVRFAVSNAIRTYEANKAGDAWVDIITPDAPIRTDALYPFVIDAATWTRLADGVVPARVGQPETILETSTRSVDDVLADLRENRHTWVTYTFHNPATGVEQVKRTYLQLHDGLVFGSGYYVLDSHIQSIAHGRVLEYERDGRAATLADVGMVPDTPISKYAFVIEPQSGHTLAQNVDPARIGGVTDWQAIGEVIPVADVIDEVSRGAGTWVAYAHTNPVTGETETKHAWLIIHDGLIFGAGHYSSDIPESDVRFAVSNAIRTYEANKAGDAWVDIITPDAPIRTDALYPFVIDAATWTRLADGVVPARVGQPETILETSTRSVDDVLADLRENRHTWVTYTFHNPATGVEQVKRTYLQLHDGLVFGSGYYVLDTRVQAATYDYILEYERDGRAATLADVGMVPDTPISTYVFVVDSATGATEAQSVDPARIGGVPDWQAIGASHSTADIIDKISRGTGTWVSYAHTHPVTGETETKRTWLVMHGGLIFGAGYYSSDVLAVEYPSATDKQTMCRR